MPATYEGMQAIGSGLGAGGFIVYDDTADMVSVSRLFARFLHVESCGQCGACKLNSGEVWSALERFGYRRYRWLGDREDWLPP